MNYCNLSDNERERCNPEPQNGCSGAIVHVKECKLTYKLRLLLPVTDSSIEPTLQRLTRVKSHFEISLLWLQEDNSLGELLSETEWNITETSVIAEII